MTRMSEALIPTLRDDPADSESVSHRLLVRAGMIRQLAAGLWTYLPAGWRALNRCEQIIREEMNRIGGQEVQVPVMQPAELWRSTGRLEIEELFKLQDRKGADLALAMTAEEAMTWHVAREIRSYRDLPQILFQIQLKERDEPRPRAGVLRTREFSMKDSYSFDRDEEGLERSYALHIEAYDRIFDRCGLEWHRCASDPGMMGGQGADEYMAPCAAGENELALAEGYAANVEIASAVPTEGSFADSRPSPEEVATPGLRTIEEVSSSLGLAPSAMLKALPVVVGGGETVVVVLRGDHRLNEVKLSRELGPGARQATAEEIERDLGPTGFIGPVGVGSRVLLDDAVQGGSFVCGGNRSDLHLTGVEPGRDFDFERADLRRVEEGDEAPGGGRIAILPAIEIGNIFRLGTRYSDAIGATYLDEGGKERPVVMGSYGIGPARVIAASVEQGADERGIVWPKSLAPWQITLACLGKPGSDEAAVADDIYQRLGAESVEVLYDDREASAGEKLTDAELIGCPLRLVIGSRGLAEGTVEVSLRDGRREASVPVESAVEDSLRMLDEAR